MLPIKFSSDIIQTLVNFSQTINNATSNSNNSTEFEIRFGKFYFDKSTNKSSFDPNSNISFFYRLKNLFIQKKFKYDIINTIETIYENNEIKGSIKKIFNKETNFTTYILKNTFKKFDVYDYDFRLSLASEKKVNKTYLDKLNTDFNKIILIREKSRFSFELPFGKLDLTIVKQDNNEKYEIELEIQKNIDINEIIQFIILILQTSQQNYFITSKNEKRQIINEYKSIFNSYFFIGAQPETLHKNQISDLYKEEYSVTDKADGDRCFLYIDKNGMVYFIDNNMDIINKTNIIIPYKCCLIDGEKIIMNNTILFMGFDLLALNNVDIRGNNKFLLKERLKNVRQIITEIENANKLCDLNNLYKFETKEFIFKNVFIGSEIILNNANTKPYKNDGLIFTPINEPYPVNKKWSKLLKWKPSHLNTIDFYAIKSVDNEDEWKLYVQDITLKESTDSTNKQINSQELILFDIQKLCPESNTITEITFKTNFDKNLIDPLTNEPFKTNTVIEFCWDFTFKKFMPVRTRWDKTTNKKKHGNFKTVACDIWNNIHSPIDKEFLFKFSTPGNKDDIFFCRMRKYHNKIKEYLYNKYCNRSSSLLELCSGRGGDMHKWLYNNIQKVVGYDVSSKNITECLRRMNQLQEINKIKYDYTFHKLDLSLNDSFKTIYQNNPKEFDNICCHFGLHYFFQSENSFKNILNILEKSLKLNGYFIVTFMDNTQLDKIFDNKNKIYEINK
jgi:hypothetical protein